MNTSSNAAARVVNGTKIYGEGETQVRALDGVDVEFQTGEFTAIMGPSGSGKSTLMHCVAGLDVLTTGQSFINDVSLNDLSDRELTLLRRDKIGFVFQAFNLIPTLNAKENLTLPMDLAGQKVDPIWMNQVVASVGIGDRLDHRPDELSGGQQQRVAVARALVSQPAIVFADEPTGNLDSEISKEILALFEKINQQGKTIIIATHSAEILRKKERRHLLLKRGKLLQS